MGKQSKLLKKSAVQEKKKEKPASDSVNQSLIIRLGLTILVFIIYGASVNFKFTLDDDMFYLKHKFVQEGLSSIGDIFSHGSLYGFDGTTGVQPYRPFTLVVFALQKMLFDNSAPMAHLVNVLLYLLMVQLLFSLLMKLIPQKGLIFPAGIALLFAVHPIHTEVVSNVKSLDELLVGVMGIASWYMFLPDENSKIPEWAKWILGSLFFFLALLSKESGISFMIIIPLSLYMLTSAGIRRTLFVFTPLLLLSVFFLMVRHNVVGTQPASSGIPLLENVLNGAQSFSQLWATKFEILFYYIKLLFIPWPLTWDYSFNQIPLVGWDSPLALLGLVIYGGLFVISLLQFRKNPILSFSILFFFITSAPTNNIFFNNGATVGERFLFVPSLGYSVGLVWMAGYFLKASGDLFFAGQNRSFAFLICGLGLAFAILSNNRSADWKDNMTLFERGVERSPNSSRAQYSLASECMTRARETDDPAERRNYLNKAKEHFTRSIEIFPANSQAHYNFGIFYSLIGDTSNAIHHYRESIKYDNDYENAMNNVGVLYMGRGRLDSAQYFFEMSLRIKPGASIPLNNMSDLNGIRGDSMNRAGNKEGAIGSYKKCITYNAGNVQALKRLGSTYTELKKFDSALVYLNKAYALNNRDISVVESISLAGFLSGNYRLAIEYANKALAIDGRSRKSLGILADTYRAMGNMQEASKYQALYNQP